MTKSIRWGILGTGKIATKFSKAVQEAPSAELLAVGSRAMESAREFAGQFGIDPGHIHGSYEALLADPGVDAVYISTPHPFHAEWCVKAAEAGKNILCEKPATLNYGEFMAVREAVRDAGVFFMEAFMYRCHPQARGLARAVRDGVIGEVRLVESSFGFASPCDAEGRLWNRELGGGSILDIGCYPLSFARMIAGAAVGKDFDDPIRVRAVGRIGETGVDELAEANLEFSSGILAHATSSINTRLRNDAVIHGTQGQILVKNPWWSTEGYLIRRDGEEERQVTPEAEHSLYVYEIEEVARALAEGRKEAQSPAMTWADTAGNMEALDAWRTEFRMYYPMETGRQTSGLTLVGRPLVRAEKPAISTQQAPGFEKPVSRVVMGTTLGTTIYKYAEVIYDEFYRQGGNTFDTAHSYERGFAEKLLGIWAEDRGVREEINIITKCSHPPTCRPQCVEQELNWSLWRLRTDYVDGLMLHRDNLEVPVKDWVEVLARMRDAGKIRAYGFSNWTLPRMQEALEYCRKHGIEPPRLISQNFSLAHMVNPVWPGCEAATDPAQRRWLEENAETLTLLPWSSQARGFFTDRSAPDKRDDEELVNSWYSDDNFERKRRATELAGKYGVLPLNIALAYTLHQPFPVFPLIGPRNLHELRTSLPGLKVKLTEEEVKWLDLDSEQ